MKEHGGALFVINRNLEEIRVECHYFEGKIRGGVRVAMADIVVPPVVCATENSQMFEDESFAIEALLLQERNSIINFFSLVGLKPMGACQKGNVPN